MPDGVRSLRDAPYRFKHAIKAALMFLNFEELPEEDVPPRNIWSDNEALGTWFSGVRRRQRDKMDGREIEDPQRNGALDMLIVGDK